MMSELTRADHVYKRRKKEERAFRFKTFGRSGHPAEFGGSFRENVKALVEHGRRERNQDEDGFRSYSFQLEVHRHPPLQVLLLVVEESIEASLPHFHCGNCIYVGWGHHMICSKKYHFLIPSREMAVSRADTLKASSRWLVLESHVLHGVFHSNGFGHLLSVNGLEAGSDLAGHQIMEFWDRLCSGLKAREVSLKDTSQSGGMDLRLLHGVAYGKPWFGHWGYRFARGTHGVTGSMYAKAIEGLQNMPLCCLVNQEISILFSRYQTLMETPLLTLGDLLRCMLELKPCLPKEGFVELQTRGIVVDPANCRWSMKRVEMAIKVIIESLKRAQNRWVSRQEVRDAARIYIGDTGLLDFVLKSLGNQVVGHYLVRRSLNPVTKVLEYCLEDISRLFPPPQGLLTVRSQPVARFGDQITRVQLMKDIAYLYTYIFKDQNEVITSDSTGLFNPMPTASRIILDAKYLVKDYHVENPVKAENGLQETLKLPCTISLRPSDRGVSITPPMLPYEFIAVKGNTSLHELRAEVERTFREIYSGLRDVTVGSISNLNAKETDLVCAVAEPGQKIVFEGRMKGEGSGDLVLCENELIGKAVDCDCGAKEEDGERMVCCDICEVWQHTRCVGIAVNEEVPRIFLCSHCEQGIVPLPSLP